MDLGTLDIREMVPAETDDMLIFRNRIFGQISRTQWDAMQCTAVVAVAPHVPGPGKFWGAIPLQYRAYQVRKDIVLPVVFENAVGVKEEARGKGLGSAMLKEAARFLHDRVEVMFVYRGGERTPGYRFYRKNNHGDLYYVQPLISDQPVGSCNTVEVVHVSEALTLESDLLELFSHCYGQMGGYWQRQAGFYERVLTSHVYKNEEWKLFLDRRSDGLEGYAITNPATLAWKGYCIYEIATTSRRSLRRLIDRIAYEAKQHNLPVTMPANREHPLYGPLLELDFRIEDDSPYVLAHMLRPDLIFKRLACASPLREELRLIIATPHRDITVNDPTHPRYSVTLWCKESQLSRLFCCRLDLAVALRTNLVRLSPLPASVLKQLCSIFRFSPWVVFGIDYI
ncbi:MAG: GNAT family N-acetyltransferase [Kiritimatiellia bacterium]